MVTAPRPTVPTGKILYGAGKFLFEFRKLKTNNQKGNLIMQPAPNDTNLCMGRLGATADIDHPLMLVSCHDEYRPVSIRFLKNTKRISVNIREIKATNLGRDPKGNCLTVFNNTLKFTKCDQATDQWSLDEDGILRVEVGKKMGRIIIYGSPPSNVK